MTQFIYSNTNLRCRLKTTGYRNQIELQIQKKWFCFWVNVYKWMHVNEGFWGECERFPILKSRYEYGNVSESYMTGTINIKKRALEFIREYLVEQAHMKSFKTNFKALNND